MKRIVILMAMGLLATRGLAQAEVGAWTIVPKVGLNWSKMSGSELYLSSGTDSKVSPRTRHGLAVGAEAEYQLSRAIGLSAGVVYSQQGFRYDDAPGFYKDLEHKVDYLNVPLVAHIYGGHGLALVAGVQMGQATHRNVSGKEYNDGGGASGWSSFSSSQTYYRTFDFSIPLGLSYDLYNFRIECRYNLGLYDTTKLDLKEKNRVVQLTVGYRFAL